MDWKERTLSHWDKINALAARRFGQGPLAEEAALAVIDGLEAEDWQRVRAYHGQASFTAFLLAVSARLLEDFARKRYGRARPPLWVRALGGIWYKLFHALCLERLAVGDAVEVVYQRQTETEKAAVETAAYELLARIPDCGTARGLEVSLEDGTEMTDGGKGPGQRLECLEQTELFRAVFQLVLARKEDVVDGEVLEKYRRVNISLTPEEELLLKLCFQDGLGLTEAGAMLGFNRFQVHGRMRRLLRRLQEEFTSCGLDQVLRPLLAD